MSFRQQVGGMMPPPLHHSRNASSSSLSLPVEQVSGSATSGAPPPLPPRPGWSGTPPVAVNESAPDSDEDTIPPAEEDAPGASLPTENLTPKEEEELSEVQLRELYNDEEIERFLYLFSMYVREVRAPGSATSTTVAHAASASAPALSETLSPPETAPSPTPSPATAEGDASRSLSERIAIDYFLPLLPPPRPPPAEFSFGRLNHTTQRLYVLLEPLYSLFVVPLLRLATWENPRKSFAYCALYWILWYHGLLISALLLRMLYSLVRKKLNPYPSLDELRAHRTRIDRSHTFGAMLSARLTTSPTLGVQDMWHVFKDYRNTQKLKKAAKVLKTEAATGETNDAASIHSVDTEKPEEALEPAIEDIKDEDLKRLGLLVLSDVADLLERVKNIFLWRDPRASIFYGAVLFGCFFTAALPARYLVGSIGFTVGMLFWHVIPILLAIPPSERSRIPPLLSKVPTDAEYAMDLISQRVARGLPVRPKKRRRRQHSTDAGVAGVAAVDEQDQSNSSSVDWNKWGDRLASTKERTGEIKKKLQDGQWKKPENWAALNPLAPVPAVAPQSGPETRIETHTFPAQLKQHPGLITLTPTTVFFTPLLSASATLSIPLADVSRVKKGSLMKSIEIHYTETRAGGSAEGKDVKFLFVGYRDDLFARLISWGGKRWTNV